MRLRAGHWLAIAGAALLAWLALAYGVAPQAWRDIAARDPALDALPGITTGGDGLPGDPVNLMLEGDAQALRRAMTRAGWSVADPLDLRDDARIALDTLADRAYPDAPVSALYLYGRVEDIAFEMPLGSSPRQRHHVRFWRMPGARAPRWAGAATLDRSVGLAVATGQVTHHIAADIDSERDHVLASLQARGLLARRWYVPGFHAVQAGRNAGGDPWRTDGRLGAARLR